MNRSLLIVFMLVPFTYGGARNTQTMAQTPQTTSADAKPCGGINAQGKPTLVRRQPIPNLPAVAQDVNDRESSENPKCTPQLWEGESVNDRLSIAELLFEGNRIFSSEELAASLRQCLVDYSEHTGSGFDRDVFDVCQRRLMSFVWSRGYLRAKLEEPRIVITGQGLVITVPVDEGMLYRLGEIKIEGAEALSPDEVKATLGMQEGDVPNGDRIAKWFFEDLKSTYGEMGFIQYTAEPTLTFKSNPRNGKEGIVDFVIYIEEGKRFTFRSLTLIGDTLSEKELRDLFLLREGRFEPLDRDRDAVFRTDEEEGTVEIVIKLQKRAITPG
jgi:outer membrane protein insertion porin family